MEDLSVSGMLDMIELPSGLRELDEEDLSRVAEELRAETIAVVERVGGHLGSGLGVVELTVVLHAVFDTPRDKLIWDVGHQVYPHKMLTGRRDRMPTLRQKGGLSGFTKRAESPFDPFGAAHAATSISAGLGFAMARDLLEDKGSEKPIGDVVCVIGDGALGGGMALEALNHTGDLGARLIVVLNDNGMSIAPTTGALAGHLKRVRAGEVAPLFEELGFRSVGPVDGHDIGDLHRSFSEIRDDASPGPVLVHVVTEKGKGHATASDPDCGHACKPQPSRPRTVAAVPQCAKMHRQPYTEVFRNTLVDLAATDPHICAITAAMPGGTGLDRFADAYPDRFFDTGIAEQHAVTFAAGLAAGGMKPFCAIYSTFLQRGYDQIVHDVALQSLPVRFAIDRAGLVGADGPTHAGAFDLVYLCALPGFTVMAPSDGDELRRMVVTASAMDDGPSAVRYPRDTTTVSETRSAPLAIGRGRLCRNGGDVAILSLGTCLANCLAAADALSLLGIEATVADARFARPIDVDLVAQLMRHHQLVLTVEEGARGGFGAQVAHLVQANSLDRYGAVLRSLTLPDRFIDHGPIKEMQADAGIDSEAISAAVAMHFSDKRNGSSHASRRFSEGITL
ncbi:1-deoxy-D-xylulose-5-phosphate synthase [Tateyamaria omphalii]|uniref:1-deoxy-D-xylulose-5-phosphate synthase n=1 Tax=Tateyamaria omphalii TaxID=299262 RepID=UPI001674AA6F|nr:1-deoxy-D-xylulose-5-phosphate synthase [Tateyamaria omphalii]GGX66686.1 1-deoxy-D-xylulose-5-phosphate synthase [Tateyamaria omphalii]